MILKIVENKTYYLDKNTLEVKEVESNVRVEPTSFSFLSQIDKKPKKETKKIKLKKGDLIKVENYTITIGDQVIRKMKLVPGASILKIDIIKDEKGEYMALFAEDYLLDNGESFRLGKDGSCKISTDLYDILVNRLSSEFGIEELGRGIYKMTYINSRHINKIKNIVHGDLKWITKK